jgi:hypothetical protein
LYRPKSNDSSESESDYESEICEYAEIKIKDITYILEGSHMYCKTKKGTKENYMAPIQMVKLKKHLKKRLLSNKNIENLNIY